MPKITAEEKQRNKEQVLMLVKRHYGIRTSEIAELTHIQRRTVDNYLAELEGEGKVYKDGVLWFADPDAGSWLRRFELAADEAYTLYLATRMFVRHTDKQNKTALSALSRLAEVLKTDLPVDEQIFEAAQSLRAKEKQSAYEEHFTTLIRAYLRRHPVQITYRTAVGNEFTTTFHIYLVEPSAIGYTLYFIGHSQHVNALRAYKTERITAVSVDLDHHYDIPEQYRTADFLQNAWSIISGAETEHVQLRFHPSVKARVLETNWHPTQTYQEQEDGFLLWEVRVASTLDMEPWIRGWGADVEVLEPEGLQEVMKWHVRRSAINYGLNTAVSTDPTNRLLRLWGKTSRHSDLFHPALYHMLDVAHVAQQLLSPRATPRWRQVLGHTLGTNPDALYECSRFAQKKNKS